MLRAAGEFLRAFVKWLAVAAVTGAAGGLIGSAFYLAVAGATGLREAHGWLLWLLPIAGAAIALMYRALRLDGLGTDTVIDAIHEGRAIKPIRISIRSSSPPRRSRICAAAARAARGAALQIGGAWART